MRCLPRPNSLLHHVGIDPIKHEAPSWICQQYRSRAVGTAERYYAGQWVTLCVFFGKNLIVLLMLWVAGAGQMGVRAPSLALSW